MDRNRYNKSILDTEDGICFICGREVETARHEIYFGSNRRLSKRLGFWVNLCPCCHQYGDYAVHKCRETDLYLKRLCQRKYEEKHTRDEFMAAIGKNYNEN